MKVVYKITYPNGKIYIGKDLTNSLTYFGSVNSDLVAEDFTQQEMQDFTIRKQILFSSQNSNKINEMEVELIRKLRSNDPKIGYNRWLKFKTEPSGAQHL